MIITTAGLACYALLTPLIPSLYWILFVAFWGGIFSSGQVLAFFNGLLEVCGTPIQRPARIAAYNTLVNVAAFAAPLISTVFVDRIGIENMLIAGGLLRLFGTFLIWQQRALDKKPRATG
jgi:predicted MFS family arabinose efflux permease